MSAITKLDAVARERAGKGAARACRRQDLVPAVIYGDNQEPVLIALNEKALRAHCDRASFFTHQFDLAVGGKAHRVLPRDIQRDPVSERPTHVDFLRVGPNTVLTVSIPVAFAGQLESPGLKRGGVINIVAHDIRVRCKANDIPEKLVVNLAGLDIGESIHMSAIKLPAGVKALLDPGATVASIAAPSAMRSEAEEKAQAAAAAAAGGDAAAPAAAAAAPAKAGDAKAAAPAPAKK